MLLRLWFKLFFHEKFVDFLLSKALGRIVRKKEVVELLRLYKEVVPFFKFLFAVLVVPLLFQVIVQQPEELVSHHVRHFVFYSHLFQNPEALSILIEYLNWLIFLVTCTNV